jgi:hypothetical protein
VNDAIAVGELFTTGAWYWRLARTVAAESMGRLSRATSELSEHEQQLVGGALTRFPDEIGMLHLRTLVPVMATLTGPPNLLTAEAVAAAIVRNLSTHDLTVPEEQKALEMLATLSLVARLVESATVESVP